MKPEDIKEGRTYHGGKRLATRTVTQVTQVFRHEWHPTPVVAYTDEKKRIFYTRISSFARWASHEAQRAE